MKHYGIEIRNLLTCFTVHQSLPQTGKSPDTYFSIPDGRISVNASKPSSNTTRSYLLPCFSSESQAWTTYEDSLKK